MSIYYKLYPEEETFIEVMVGNITIDNLSAYFLELEHRMNFNDATYVYSDHREATFNFSDVELEQLSNGFFELSKAYDFKKWALLYQDDNKHMQQTRKTMSKFMESKEEEFMKFFKNDQLKESFEFLEVKNGEELLNQFLIDIKQKSK